MEKVEESLEETLSIALAKAEVKNPDIIMSVLKSLGVLSIKDLKEVMEEDLTDRQIPVIEARKAMKAFGNENQIWEGKEKEEEKKLQKKKSFTEAFKIASKGKAVKLLVLGETGSGKSTFINAFYNHIKGIEFDKTKCFVIPCKDHACNVERYNGHSKESEKSESESQTQQCFTYYFENGKYKVTLIDTPGIGDTKGIEADKIHIKEIIDQEKLHADINAVCLVHQMGNLRKNFSLRYYISEIKSMLPKSFKDNFIVCLTRGTGNEKPTLATLNEMGINTKYYVKLENSALLVEPSPKDDQNKKFWEDNNKEYEKILEIASKLPTFTTVDFRKLSSKKVEYIKLMEEHILRIENLNKEKEAVNAIAENLKKCSSTIDINKNFEEEIVVEQRVPDESKPKYTRCTKCKTKCHDPCYLPRIYETKGDKNLIGCACMIKERCKECECTYEEHTHAGYIDKIIKIKRKEINPAKKSAFDSASQEKITLEEAKKKLNQVIVELEAQISEAESAISTLYFQIKELSLLPYNDTYEEYLNMALEIAKKENQTEKVKRLTLDLKRYNIEKELIQKSESVKT